MNVMSETRPVAGRAIDAAEWEARVNLAACYRLVAKFGMDDLVYNHISLRVPGHDDQFLINPYGLMYDEITASSLVRINTDGDNIDDAPGEVNRAGFVIHAAIHKARHDAACVLHTHSDAALAVSAQEHGLLPLSQFAMIFYGRQAFHDYEGVALDLDEQTRLQRDLGPHRVMVMRNHGLLTVGRTPAEAFVLQYYFERAARIQLQMQAAAAGGVPFITPAREVCEKTARQFSSQAGDILPAGEREWPALLRQLDRSDPSYRT